jgi:AraC-like DNA-binding protein
MKNFKEWSAWAPVFEGWKPIHARYYSEGFSIESHQFKSSAQIDWAKSFHGNGLEICFNISGTGRLTSGKQNLEFLTGTEGFYRADIPKIQGFRAPNETHYFITIEITSRFLNKYVSPDIDKLFPAIQRMLKGKSSNSKIGEVRPLTMAHRLLVSALINPPVPTSALDLWYHGKALGIIAETLYISTPDKLISARQTQIIQNRVEEVKQLLSASLENPLSLDEISKKVGCSPFYLSRTFSKETGLSIPQYIRSLRMEKAAELLRSGKYNVTETAIAVGYNSLSHFSKVFCEVFGKCPCVFPLRRTP